MSIIFTNCLIDAFSALTLVGQQESRAVLSE